MLTKNEITALNLSPTKKDFVQIWNELLEVAGKLSERWDPTSTNESDPGIVLLKALTGIADKLNYNIDKNTLEAFMPTAAQEESMRKLCDMLGYSMKYYRSAIADVTIRYHNSDPTADEYNLMAYGLEIPRFTVITNADKDVNYFTLEPVVISEDSPSKTISCMEGQLVQCESNNEDNIITVNQIINNKYYLPETQIAENGIFIYNAAVADTDYYANIQSEWESVLNLNLYPRESKVFKFGYDSYEGRPYIEFPEDYSELFGEGVFIFFTRTNGINGNISRSTLSQIELPSNAGWEKVDPSAFGAENVFAATNGANSETIAQAYNSFKKTVGTFDTLVTCRDYMNKIYTMTEDNKAIVSNVLVTDIRNDLNRAVCICSCDDAGIFYKETALKEQKSLDYTVTTSASNDVEINKPVFIKYDTPIREVIDEEEDIFREIYGYWCLETAPAIKLFTNGEGDRVGFDAGQDGFVSIKNGRWEIAQNDDTIFFDTGLDAKKHVTYEQVETRTDTVAVDAIERFDIVLYPFKTYSQVKSSFADLRTPYDRSYKYSRALINDITLKLKDSNCKTLAHNLLAPDIGHVVSINNYLKLNANVATNAKVSNDESLVIIDNIKKALANAFNMHELDFGEEIPFDSILKVIEKADARIKVVSLNEPTLYTTYSVIEGYSLTSGEPEIAEYAVASKFLSKDFVDDNDRFIYNNQSTYDTTKARSVYNSLAVRNVLAGRVPLFKYNDKFTSSFSEGPYQTTVKVDASELTGIADGDGHVPSAANPRTMWVSNGATFTGTFTGVDADGKDIIEYTKTYTPTIYGADPDKTPNVDSLSSISQGVTGGAGNAALTSISAFCTIAADGYNVQDGYVDAIEELSNTKAVPVAATTEPADTTAVDESGPTIDDLMAAMAEGDEEALEQMQAQLDKSNKAAAAAAEAAYQAEASQIDKITNVDLSAGEYIKFRAPNFTTAVTYPAYVNYNLKLKTGTAAEAQPAEAATLFSQFDADHETWTPENQNIRWQKVLNYFTALDATNGTNFKKKIVLSQTISKMTEAPEEGEEAQEEAATAPTKGPISVSVNNETIKPDEESFEDMLNNSGCLKLLNPEFKAILEWDTSEGDIPPGGTVPLELALDISNPFITNAKVFTELQDSIDAAIQQAVADESASLPTECAWKIIFEFEYVPIEPASLNAWETFIRYCAANTNNPASPCYNIFDFVPCEDNNSILFRTFEGGYEPGKMKTANSEKLLKFTKTYFNTIPDARLTGLYLIKSTGTDAIVSKLNNDEEYTLDQGEYLFIEYTPSSTSEDGSQQKSEPVTKVYEPGTVIRPKGFESAIADTSTSTGGSGFKTVKFTTSSGSTVDVEMSSLGPNEQIEIRDYAKTVFNKDTFELYVFKNFENCPELEKLNGNNGSRSYTLKDGEYVFYTDKNKADLAYFSTGTCVTLSGKALIRGGDSSTDISAIFENGVDAINWTHLPLTGENDSVEFQEFQYITLGPGDKLDSLDLVGNHARCLNSSWQFCDNVSYTVAGEDKPAVLPKISCPGRFGNGWEASSILQLSVSPESAQTLRNTGKVKTSIVLGNVSTIGEGTNAAAVVISPDAGGDDLSFKTNVACVSNGSTLDIEDVQKLYSDVSNFELKAFKATDPAIVCTEPNKVIEIDTDAAVELVAQAERADGQANTQTGSGNTAEITEDELNKAKASVDAMTNLNDQGSTVSKKSYVDFWNSVDLKNIQCGGYDSNNVLRTVDRALSVPILLLPNTYGVCCLYVDYYTDDADNKVWLEVAPGTPRDSITILNISKDENAASWETPKDSLGRQIANAALKLYLKPGINCLKVSNVNKIYIKASSNATGMVYFDELRLVNCDFVDSNGNIAPGACAGLNIEQIGYVLNDPKEVFTQAAKEARQKAIAESTAASIQGQINEVAALASSSLRTLQSEKANLSALVAGEHAMLTDLTRILTAATGGTNAGNGDHFVTLFNRNYTTDTVDGPMPTLKCKNYIPVIKNQTYCLHFNSCFYNKADIPDSFNFVNVVNYYGELLPLTVATYEYDDSLESNGYYLKPAENANTHPDTAMRADCIKEYFYIFNAGDNNRINIHFNSYPGSTPTKQSVLLDDVQINRVIPCIKTDDLGLPVNGFEFERDATTSALANLVPDGDFERGQPSECWVTLKGFYSKCDNSYNYDDVSNLQKLLNVYQDTLSAQHRAEDLLKDINEGSNEVLEQQLAELLLTLNSKEESADLLEAAFNELTSIINDKLDNLDEDDIVEAFTTDCSDYSFVIGEARECTTDKIFEEVTVTGLVAQHEDSVTSITTSAGVKCIGVKLLYTNFEKLQTNDIDVLDCINIAVSNDSDIMISDGLELTATGTLIKCDGALYLADSFDPNLLIVRYDKPTLINAKAESYYSGEKVIAVKANFNNSVNAIKAKATENFENEFKKQLGSYLTDLKALTAGDTNSELTTLLDQVTDTLNAVDYPGLRSYILKLQELVEQDDLNTIISEMTTAAASADYVLLYNSLIKLRDTLQTSDVKQLVIRVADTFEGKDYPTFNELVEELETILGTASSIITDINNLIGSKDDSSSAKTVLNKLKEEEPKVDTTIISAVDMISKRVTSEHNNSLVLIVSDLISEIEDIAASQLRIQIATVKETLKTSSDSKVTALLEQVDTLVSSYNTTLASVLTPLNKLPINLDSITSYAAAAVVEIWPEQLKIRWSNLIKDIIDDVDAELDDILYNNGRIDSSAEYSKANTLFSDYSTRARALFNAEIYAKVCDSTAYEKFTNVSRLLNDCRQTTGFTALAYAVNDVLPGRFNSIINTFNSAVAKYPNINTNNSSAYLVELLKEFQDLSDSKLNGASLTMKPQLLSDIRKALTQNIKQHKQIASIAEQILLPTFSQLDLATYENNAFFQVFMDKYNKIKACFASEGINALADCYSSFKLGDIMFDDLFATLAASVEYMPVDIASGAGEYASLFENDTWSAAQQLLSMDGQTRANFSLMPDKMLIAINDIAYCIKSIIYLTPAVNTLAAYKESVVDTLQENLELLVDGVDNVDPTKRTDGLQDLVNNLDIDADANNIRYIALLSKAISSLRALSAELSLIYAIDPNNYMQTQASAEATLQTELLARTTIEEQLLDELRSIDINRDFYYNVPIELCSAIDFNDSETINNTLLNPVFNYDSNNINNSFVISKLDIDYLDKGIQIARTSKRS